MVKPKFRLYDAARNPRAAVTPRLEVSLHGGTAFCVDPECRFIGTDYHVAADIRVRKIGGIKVIGQYLATGPDDEGVSLNFQYPGRYLSYNVAHDLAMFELLRPLPHHHGLSYSLDELQPGQQVDMYCYPKESESISPGRSLMLFHGEFRGQAGRWGLLQIAYQLVGDDPIRGGASGGLVVDRGSGRVVGILVARAREGSRVVFAIPVQALVDFVSKARPYLAQSIFPSTEYVSPVAPDFYPRFAPPRVDAIQRRPEEPPEVKALRARAQELADNIRDFIAVQTFAWGSGHSAPFATAQYEVRVLDGQQQFREYPDGKEVLTKHGPLPALGQGVTTGGEWAGLPRMVGTELDLKVQQAPDAVVDGRPIKVFRFRAEVEDELCGFEEITEAIFFSFTKVRIYSCYGEVWTDEATNILRISENYEMRRPGDNLRSVVTYGWLRMRDEPARLIPATISLEVRHGKRVYWCRGEFINYQVFTTKARILPGRVAP